MSKRRLENWIESFLDYTEETEPSVMYRRWTALSTIAAVLQRKCFVELGSETFYPNLYVVLVGPPAARKGTAMKVGRDMLETLGIRLAADESSRQKLLKTLVESSIGEPDEMQRINFHASLSIYSSELTVFLGYHNNELLSMLCDWYDCRRSFKYDTHARGEETVSNVWVNLFGATTPTMLQTALPESAVGSGFTSRTIFVFEEDKGKVVVIPELRKDLYEPLIQDLMRIKTMAGQFSLTPQSLDLYSAWRIDMEENNKLLEPRLESYVQRRPTHLMKLSLIYSAVRGDDYTVSEDDMARAIWTLEETEKKMANVFRGVGQNPMASVQIRLMKVLAERREVPIADIHTMFFSDANSRQIAEIITALQMMGYCQLDVMTRTLKFTRGYGQITERVIEDEG